MEKKNLVTWAFITQSSLDLEKQGFQVKKRKKKKTTKNTFKSGLMTFEVFPAVGVFYYYYYLFANFVEGGS